MTPVLRRAITEASRRTRPGDDITVRHRFRVGPVGRRRALRAVSGVRQQASATILWFDPSGLFREGELILTGSWPAVLRFARHWDEFVRR